MKVIIAGGRDFKGENIHAEWIKEKFIELDCTEIVSGHCAGADYFGEVIAHIVEIPCTIFPADWAALGKSAGPVRNEQMAEYADACILFPGGRGTEDMKRRALKHGLKVVEYARSN